MDFDFDSVVNRRNTHSMKWDGMHAFYETNDLLPMWVADMDFKSPICVRDLFAKTLEQGVFGYNMLDDDLRNSIVTWVKKRHGWDIEKDWIGFTPGVVSALSTAIQFLTNKGDGVLIQPPVYHPFYNVINDNGRKLITNPLKHEDGRYYFDLDDLEGKIKKHSPKMLILCNPHNPSGRVWEKEELIQLGEICSKHGVIVISDEIHCDLTLSGVRHHPFGMLSTDGSQKSIVAMAASKTFNIAGLGFSFVIVPDMQMRERYLKKIETLQIGHGSTFGLLATMKVFEEGEAWLAKLIEYIEGNFDFLSKFIANNLPDVRVMKPDASFLVWLDFNEYAMSEVELQNKFLEDAKVAPNFGEMFGKEGRGFVRLNMGCPRATLKQGLNQILEAFTHNTH
ncbi:MAG: MalY/PatB family protein [Bacteroidales bacterium]